MHRRHDRRLGIALLAACGALWAAACSVETKGEGVTPESDKDNDTIADELDNCPGHANVAQADFDDASGGGDGTGNVCQYCAAGGGPDVDEDGIPDGVDSCFSWRGENPPVSGDSDIDNYGEGKGDGIIDHCDNCPLLANDDQGNGDCDDIGDACEMPGLTSALSWRIAKPLRDAGPTESWVEQFMGDTWVSFAFASGGKKLTVKEGADLSIPQAAVAPSYYEKAIDLTATAYALVADLTFDQGLAGPVGEEGGVVAAGILLHVTVGDDHRPASWYSCTVGKVDDGGTARFEVQIRRKEEGCAGEGDACVRGRLLKATPLADDAELAAGQHYVLQAVKTGEGVFCYLRDRVFTPQSGAAYDEANFLHGGKAEHFTSAAADETFDDKLGAGLLTDGAKATFWAVSVYGG